MIEKVERNSVDDYLFLLLTDSPPNGTSILIRSVSSYGKRQSKHFKAPGKPALGCGGENHSVTQIESYFYISRLSLFYCLLPPTPVAFRFGRILTYYSAAMDREASSLVINYVVLILLLLILWVLYLGF
ncbi:hypothetical protein CDAR_216941 [Caerostris darwini]|uniref:Uncharacterized protein n=1 Tax=Caerostris darwini TaxID=1538125 RepID=A0AAV4UTQ3_9ARAC|nr:hypothetical protein CDAR_216941 [Caerostris darwini]